MIIVDVETSGVNPKKHALLSIGAVDFENPSRTFYGECRIFPGAEVTDVALEINGFTRASIIDANKPSLNDLMRQFLHWILEKKDITLAGHNVVFDRDFLNAAFKRCNMHAIYWKRTVDVHTLCFADHVRRGLTPPTREAQSALSLNSVLEYCGLPKEPTPHNALSGAKCAAEALSRLILGKNLFNEHMGFDVPVYLARKEQFKSH